jgi:hypothetical protein
MEQAGKGAWQDLKLDINSITVAGYADAEG